MWHMSWFDINLSQTFDFGLENTTYIIIIMLQKYTGDYEVFMTIETMPNENKAMRLCDGTS